MMKRFSVTAPLLVACLWSVSSAGFCLPPSVTPAAQDTVIETLHLTYLLPSEVVRVLKGSITDLESGKKASAIPAGIADTVPNDTDRTLIVWGTRASLAEMKDILLLLDVKPRQVQVRARLIEVQLTEKGTRKETVLQSPLISTNNNQAAQISIGAPTLPGASLQITPHLNGDKTVTVALGLTLRWLAGGKESQRVRAIGSTNYVRVTKPGEWKALSELSLSDNEQLQKSVLQGTKPPRTVYPLYRLEVSAGELAGALASKR